MQSWSVLSQTLQASNVIVQIDKPLSEILLLLRSSHIKVLLVFNAIPIAIAPSSQNPFQLKSKNLIVMLIFMPAQIASAPCAKSIRIFKYAVVFYKISSGIYAVY